MRVAAAYALGEIGQYAPGQVTPILRPALEDPDENVKETAREAMKKLKAK